MAVGGAVVIESELPFAERPRQDSNLRTRVRNPMLYPLSYEGGGCRILGSAASSARVMGAVPGSGLVSV